MSMARTRIAGWSRSENSHGNSNEMHCTGELECRQASYVHQRLGDTPPPQLYFLSLVNHQYLLPNIGPAATEDLTAQPL